jgi:4-phytase / acid phosphatase
VVATSTLDSYSVQPFPDFGIPPGNLTANGAKIETILGGYYRLWLTQEGLLTGNDIADSRSVYIRANLLERTQTSAQAFAAGLLPAATLTVNSYQTGSDPLFDPVGAGVAQFDSQKQVAAIEGRLGGNPQWLATAYGAENALARSVLFHYPAGQNPLPATPAGIIDVTTIPITVTAGSPANLGGLITAETVTDTFLLEYAEGMAAADVAWGQLTTDGIGQITRIANLFIDLDYRTPYLDQVQSSNLASHVVRSLVQSATGNASTGSLGNPQTSIIVMIASDVNIAGLAGLFHLDWVLPGYQQDYCSLGGALVVQLRQSQSTGEFLIRASYISQTLDQLHNQSSLTLGAPPASAAVFIPGCSIQNATFDCPLGDFVALAKRAIDPQSTDLIN